MTSELREKVIQILHEWSGSDAAPGHLTWDEVQREFGLSPEEARLLAPSDEQILASLPADDVLGSFRDEVLRGVVWQAADGLWLAAIKAAKPQA